MKRYLLFTMHQYYPSGGCRDLADTFDDLTEAVQYAKQCHCDWWHILDIQTGEIQQDYLFKDSK